ncbi:MAG TPA: ion channel [Polyangiaceae bacterium]|nr:ion channel [Polyangiaceae bacterium]
MSQPVRASGPPRALVRLRTIGRSRSPVEDLYHTVLTLKWWQFFLAVGVAFVAANAVFAVAYAASPGSIANARPGSFEDGFFFSVQTMATIGYGQMSPASRLGQVLVTLEAVIGVLSFALITGVTFSKFSRPTARVLFAERAVIGPRDGVPHLMFRMANYRHNTIIEAQLRIILLLEEITLEGQVMRRPYELPLVRDRNSTFVLTWTAMHAIDEKSPFFGPDAFARLRHQKAEIFLSLTGTDETFAQTIHARRGYRLDDVVEGAYFEDVLTVHADGTRIIDYARFHDVVPLSVWRERHKRAAE